MRISVQVRLAVDLKLFIDTLEIAFMCAMVGDDVEHTIVTDQCKIYIHETEEDEPHRLLYCTSSQKYSSRCFQDEHHSATNNDALTGKFDVTTIELSAGRRRLQPPIEQLEKHQQQHTQHKNKPHIMSVDALFGQGIFEDLQRKIDEETAVKDVCGD